MRIRTIVTTALVGCVAIIAPAGSHLAAQAAPVHKPAATAQATPASGMAAKCQAMMADHETMMKEAKAADLRLDGLVADMNAATGQPKIDAAAAVINEMVAQRNTMRDRMMTMQSDMMSHMMEHMQAGKDSMATCPMMKMKPMGGPQH